MNKKNVKKSGMLLLGYIIATVVCTFSGFAMALLGVIATAWYMKAFDLFNVTVTCFGVVLVACGGYFMKRTINLVRI